MARPCRCRKWSRGDRGREETVAWGWLQLQGEKKEVGGEEERGRGTRREVCGDVDKLDDMVDE